jgi:hypothetical protein
MEKSNYILLPANKRRPERLVAKYRASEQMEEIKLLKTKFPQIADNLVDNDYGFMDRVQYNNIFTLATFLGHGICRLEDFIDFLQSLKSERARDGNGRMLKKNEANEILEDILGKKDSFRGKYKIHGERFASRLVEEAGKVFLVSYAATQKGPSIDKKEPAKYVKSKQVKSSSFNAQGFPTQKGKDWNFWFPENLSQISKRREEHTPLQFSTNLEGINMLIGSYLGVNGIYNGLGFRLLTYPDMIKFNQNIN